MCVNSKITPALYNFYFLTVIHGVLNMCQAMAPRGRYHYPHFTDEEWHLEMSLSPLLLVPR